MYYLEELPHYLNFKLLFMKLLKFLNFLFLFFLVFWFVLFFLDSFFYAYDYFDLVFFNNFDLKLSFLPVENNDFYLLQDNIADSSNDRHSISLDNSPAAPAVVNVGSNGAGDLNDSLTFFSKTKRLIFWKAWEKHRNRYSSFNDFKNNWDNNTKIFKVIKTDVKNDINNDLHQLRVIKNTIAWLFNRRNPN